MRSKRWVAVPKDGKWCVWDTIKRVFDLCYTTEREAINAANFACQGWFNDYE